MIPTNANTIRHFTMTSTTKPAADHATTTTQKQLGTPAKDAKGEFTADPDVDVDLDVDVDGDVHVNVDVHVHVDCARSALGVR